MAGKKSKKNQKILDYKFLFETSSPNEFLGAIFFSHNFTRTLSTKYKADYSKRLKEVNQVFNYFHKDDLYKYFQINHELYKDKSKVEYTYSLYNLILDLIKQTPSVDFIPLEDDFVADPVYIEYAKMPSILLNVARDFFHYSDIDTIQKKESIHFYDCKAFLKEIYQKGLLPLDISQQSYF